MSFELEKKLFFRAFPDRCPRIRPRAAARKIGWPPPKRVRKWSPRFTITHGFRQPIDSRILVPPPDCLPWAQSPWMLWLLCVQRKGGSLN